MNQYCTKCGNIITKGNRYCSFCGTQQPADAPVHTEYMPQQTADWTRQPTAQKQTQKSVLGLVAIITAAVVVVVCTASYFLFFADRPADHYGNDVSLTETDEAGTEPTQKPIESLDYASTRDAEDLIGVWEGSLEYTEISGNWEAFTYPVSQGYSQPFRLKITEDSPALNWRQAIINIDGGDAAVVNVGFEGGFLEIRGEWQSCDVSISVAYDENRGGFAGIGEYIHPEKHASFDFFMRLADESSWDNPQAVVSPSDQPQPTQVETLSEQTITISMDYDSGTGVYTGEVNNDGMPNGHGRFSMQTSDTGKNWSYEGKWENGVIAGEGVMKQDDFIFTGSFKSGLLDGYCEITDGGILRYKGICAGGKLHGQGTLYTSSGMLLFEGEFQNDMLAESTEIRQAHGAAFKPQCQDMDDMLYAACLAQANTFGYPVAIWGFPLAMGDQFANGTIVIGHMGEDSYPVCLVYRYGVDEPKMTAYDWINAWGVVSGLYEYVDDDGLTVTCPMIEVVCWNNEQEGL